MTYRVPLAEMAFCAAQIIGRDRLAETELFAKARPATQNAAVLYALDTEVLTA